MSGPSFPIFSAYAVIKAFLQRGKSVDDVAEQAELDREELREVEYEEMGLPLPQRPVERSARRRFLGRFGRR